MSLQTYQTTQNATEHPRQVEYRLFAEITRGMLTANKLEGPRRQSAIAEAVHRNRSLWLTLEADCIHTQNAMPVPLRAAIISLSLWVNRQSSLVLKGDGALEALIDVNRSIMEGLAPAP